MLDAGLVHVFKFVGAGAGLWIAGFVSGYFRGWYDALKRQCKEFEDLEPTDFLTYVRRSRGIPDEALNANDN